MENLNLEGSAKTPIVTFNAQEGKLELKGRSIPENSLEFYRPLYEWLDKYGENPKDTTILEVKLEYFNTSSSKCMLDLFKKLQTIYTKGNNVEINWYFEQDDEDMKEAGEDYKSIISIPFNIVGIDEI